MEAKLIEKYRDILLMIVDAVMKDTGNNVESTEFVLESALDLALTDNSNEFYK